MKRNVALIVSAVLLSGSLFCIFLLYAESRGIASLGLSREESEWLARNDGKILVGGDPNYPPIDFYRDDGTHSGISEDILSLVESRLHFSFIRFTGPSWAEVVDAVREGRASMLFAVAPTPERSEFLDYTEPYITMPTVYVVASARTGLNSVRDLLGKKVCITKSYATFSHFTRDNPGYTIIPTVDDEEGLRMVATGNADAAVSDLPTISYLVDRDMLSRLRIAGETGYTWNLSFGVRKDMSELRGILDKVLRVSERKIQETVLEKWIDVEYRNIFYDRDIWSLVIISVAIVSALLFLVGMWDTSLRFQVRRRTAQLNGYKASLESLVAERTRALESANRQLEILATTDPLTGCYNRRYLHEMGEREFARARRVSHAFAVIMFDLDHFKAINDTWGHPAGDMVLQTVCGAVASMLRRTDVFARLGGEEFYILMPDTDEAEAAGTAERFREAVENLDGMRQDGQEIRVSASFGLSVYRSDDADFNATMLRVDKAMYTAKNNGRNRVERVI